MTNQVRLPWKEINPSLYELIWKRTLAYKMSDGRIGTHQCLKKNRNTHKEEIYRANGEVIQIDGFLKYILEGTDEEDIMKSRKECFRQ